MSINNTFLLKIKNKELALRGFRVNAQLTIWKSHQVFSKNVLDTVKSAFHLFPSCWHFLSSPSTLKSLFMHLAQYCLTTFSVQLQEMLPSPCCQWFSQPTHILPLPLYNTLHLCNAFLSSFSRFFQIYYFISLLDNPVMNTDRSNPKFVNRWILKSHLEVGCLEPRSKIWHLDLRLN